MNGEFVEVVAAGATRRVPPAVAKGLRRLFPDAERGVAQDWTKDEHGLFTGSRPSKTKPEPPPARVPDPKYPDAVLGQPYPMGKPGYNGYVEPASHVSLKSGLRADIQSYGDAVPGGYNGGFVAFDADTGAKMGWIDYQSASGDPVILIAMNEVLRDYWGKGVSDALLARLMAEFPGRPISPGLMTTSGSKWWDRVKVHVPVAPARSSDDDDHYHGAWSGGKKSEGGHPGSGGGATASGDKPSVSASVLEYEAKIQKLDSANEWGQIWDAEGNPIHPGQGIQGSTASVPLFQSRSDEMRVEGGVLTHLHPYKAEDEGAVPTDWVSFSDGDVLIHLNKGIGYSRAFNTAGYWMEVSGTGSSDAFRVAWQDEWGKARAADRPPGYTKRSYEEQARRWAINYRKAMVAAIRRVPGLTLKTGRAA